MALEDEEIPTHMQFGQVGEDDHLLPKQRERKKELSYQIKKRVQLAFSLSLALSSTKMHFLTQKCSEKVTLQKNT